MSLMLFNGRLDGYKHGYIAANSIADALRVAEENYPYARITRNEITVYWSGRWGNPMIGITPERGMWAEKKGHAREIVRLVKSKEVAVERGPEWAEFQAKEKAERDALREQEERKNRMDTLYWYLHGKLPELAPDDPNLTFTFEGHRYEIREVEA